MSSSTTKYWRSKQEASNHYGYSERHIGTIMSKAGITRTKSGISKAKLAEAMKEHERTKLTGDGSLRDEKTKREIDKLDIEIGRMRETLKPVDEWLSELREVSAIIKVSLEEWVQHVAAEFKDANLLTRAQDVRDRCLNRIAERVKDAEHSNSKNPDG